MRLWGKTYQKVKKWAQVFYTTIGVVNSVKLGGAKVSFTHVGFNYIIRKGKKIRPQTEQVRRFRLLPYAEGILKSPNAEVSHMQRRRWVAVRQHGRKVRVDSIMHFWTFSEKIHGKRVKLVVSQINKGKKQFLSIMGK